MNELMELIPHACFYSELRRSPGVRQHKLIVGRGRLNTSHVSHNIQYISPNTRLLSNAALMLGQRRRRWLNINPALGKR